MSRSPAIRDRVAASILDVAAGVLADRGEAASMIDVAAAAGMSRATLYRYFPSREALVAALYEAAFADFAARIADARLDTVPVAEATARLTRAVLTVAGAHRALAVTGKTPGQARDADTRLLGPIRALVDRGAAEGAFRPDLPAPLLFEVYSGLLEGMVGRVIQGRLGVEEASAAVTTLFLTGATAPGGGGGFG